LIVDLHYKEMVSGIAPSINSLLVFEAVNQINIQILHRTRLKNRKEIKRRRCCYPGNAESHHYITLQSG
jgi:hypothetical protein